jgi:hypothetical protein
MTAWSKRSAHKTSVVAMPPAFPDAAAKTSPLAFCTSLGSSEASCAPGAALPKPSKTQSTASRDATSPRSCPPTPSASAKSQPRDRTSAGVAGGKWPRQSSFPSRTSPGSESWVNSRSSISYRHCYTSSTRELTSPNKRVPRLRRSLLSIGIDNPALPDWAHV